VPIQNSTLNAIALAKDSRPLVPSDSVAGTDAISSKHEQAKPASVAQQLEDHCGRYNSAGPIFGQPWEESNNILSQPPCKTSLFARIFPSKGKSQESSYAQGPLQRRDHSNYAANALVGEHLTTAGPINSTQARKGQCFFGEDGNLKLEETATDLWQRAIKLEADRRASRHWAQEKPLQSNISEREIEHSHSKPSEGTAPIIRHARNASSIYSRSHDDGKSVIQSPKLRPVTDHEDAHITSSALQASNRVLNEWQQQVHSKISSQGQAPSFITQVNSSRKSQTTSYSWARWPSHNRDDRNGAAGTGDSVISRDFATADTVNSGVAKWFTNKKSHSLIVGDPRATAKQQSFAKLLVRTLRVSWAKFLPDRENTRNSLRGPIEANAKPSNSKGYSEYPELELLAHHGSFKELEALEQTIDHFKNPPIINERRSGRLSGASSKAPLSLRLAQEVQSLKHDERNGSPDPESTLLATVLPNTPTDRRKVSHAASTTSQPYGTPMTHVSYEDCVPTHMLDENNSAKSDTEVTAKRAKSIGAGSTLALPHKYSTWTGRAKSVSIKQIKARGSRVEMLATTEQEKTRGMGDSGMLKVL
jgi:hypothetical protein